MGDPFENQRLFSDAYTPLSQHRIADRSVTADDFIAQLRFDMLLARQVVIPDTYLLDGRLFLELGPNKLFRLLGLAKGDGALEIGIRAETLERSLATLLERVIGNEAGLNDPRLAPMPFNFLTDVEVRDQLASELGGRGTKGVVELRTLIHRHGTAKGVASLLRGALLSIGAQEAADEVDVAAQGWVAWIQAEKDGKLALRRYQPQTFPIFCSMEVEPLEIHPCASEWFQRIVAEVRTDSHRASVTQMIREALPNATTEERLDLLFLEGWYTRARHRALAIQHRSVLSRAESLELAPRAGPLQDAVRRTIHETAASGAAPVVLLPDHFTRGLRAMSGPVFGEVRKTAHAELERWWQEKDVSSLRTVIALLEKRLDFAKPVDEGPEAFVQVLASVGGIAATLAVAASKTFPDIPAGVWASIATASTAAWLKMRKPARLRSRVVEYGLWRLGHR